jgi:tetratricopeptide (TPR) repeat protein
MARYQGRLEEALDLAEQAMALALQKGEVRLVARTQRVLARVLTDHGRFDEARDLASQALSSLEAIFDVHGVIDCERTLYSINEMDPRAHASTLNLGMALLGQGRFAEAEEIVRGAVQVFARHDSRAMWGLGRCVLAGCLAALGRWDEFERELEEGARILDDMGVSDVDIALVARDAGKAARAAGRDELADRAFELAADWFDQVGQSDNAEDARTRRRTDPGVLAPDPPTS